MGYEVPSKVHVYVMFPRKEILKEGEIVSDGTEQTLIEIQGIINLEGYVDLSAMEDGDVVILKRYVKIRQEDDYKLHGEETYNGRQPQPLIRFPPIAGYHGIKVTLQQTSGTYKSFPYQFFREM